MRRSLFIGAAMVVTLLLAFSLMGTPSTRAEESYDPALQQATVTATSPAGLPNTGEEGGANIALLGVLGALALGVAGVALLSGGRKSESES
jgi:LPXTG-motif cell wall-anchored protein